MANSKLTLSVEAGTIEKAKIYAKRQHISLSKLFTHFVEEITNNDHKNDLLFKKIKETEIPENIKSLTGILKGKAPENFDYKTTKYEYLKEKYGLKQTIGR